MPSKKSPSKKNASTKKTARKAAAKKPAAKKAAARKTAVKKTAAKKTAGKKAAKTADSAKTKASEIIRRQSHTPAIFKIASKRPAHILFTIEEVREVIRKRAKEEKEEKAAAQKTAANNTATKTVEVAGGDIAPPQKSRHQAASLEDILGLSGGGSGNPNQAKVPRKFQKYYNLLIELRDEVRAELNLHSNDTLKRSQKEDAGDIAISVDAGTDNFDRDFALSLLSSEQEALNEIESAIRRIHNGTYGTCEVTGEPINEERLEAVPFTRFSVEGQKQHEMNVRKRVSRAGAFLNEASGEKITFGDDDGDN